MAEFAPEPFGSGDLPPRRESTIRSVLIAAILASIGVAYVVTGLVMLAHPTHSGMQWDPVIVIAAVLFLVAVSHVTYREEAVTLFWLALAGAAAISALVLSGGWRPALAAGWVLVAGFGSGRLVLGRAKPAAVALATCVGLIPLALGALVLGLVHRLSFGALAALTIVPVGAEAAVRLRERHSPLPKKGNAPRSRAESVDARILLCWTAILYVLLLSWAVAPEVQFDSLNYHLAVPRIWMARGAVVSLPDFWHSYLSHFAETLLLLPVGLGGVAAGKLFVFGVAVVFALAVFGLARGFLEVDDAVRATAVTVSAPIVAWCATTASADMVMAVFVVAGVWAVVSAGRSPGPGWLAVAGACFGAAVGAKLNSGFAILVPSLAALAIAWRSTGRLKAIAALAGSFIAVAAPWYLVTMAWTGNPLFPFFNAVFRSPLYRPVNEMMSAHLYGIGTSFRGWMSLPIELTFRTTRFGEPSEIAAGAVILAALAYPVRGRRARAPWLAALYLLVVVGLVLWGVLFQYARYLVPVAAVAGILVVASSPDSATWPGGFHRAAVALIVAAQICFLPSLFFQVNGGIPWRVALGLESADQLVREVGGGFEAVEYLNATAKPGEKVLGLNIDHLRLYLDAPMTSLSESMRLQDADVTLTGARLARFLSGEGITFLVFREIDHPPPWTPQFEMPEFLRQNAREVFHEGRTRVYRLIRPS